jgi:hypothetical protein
MWFGGRHPGKQMAVDQQAPDLAEWHVPDEFLDIHSPVSESATGAVGLGDLGGEGDYALEAGLNFGGCCHRVYSWRRVKDGSGKG